MGKGEEGIVKYTLYIGLNDKDTYRQEIPADEAEAPGGNHPQTHRRVTRLGRRVLTRMPKGPYFEDSLVYELLFVTEEQVGKS